jgi:dihydrofolate reductase
MRKLIAAMKLSLDMKYQTSQDYADWVDAWSEDYGLTAEIDACVLGGRMYRGYLQYWSDMMAQPDQPLPMTGVMASPGELAWARAIPSLPHYVVSNTLTETSWPNAHLFRSLDEVAALKQQPGKDIYLMGGGTMLQLLFEAGLVDELRLIVYPLVAGGPNTLFADSDVRRAADLVKLEPLDGGRVRMDYRFRS